MRAVCQRGSGDKWFLILRAVVCCCWVMSRPLALSSLEPSEASAGPSVSRQEPRSQSSREHTKLKMHNFLRFVHNRCLPFPLQLELFPNRSLHRRVTKRKTTSLFRCHKSLSFVNGFDLIASEGLMKATRVTHRAPCLFDCHTSIKAK